VPQAIACFERAIALDPGYAEAMASMSDSYRLMGVFGGVPPAEVMPKAQALAERALAINSELAEAWATIAAVEEQYHRNFARSDSLYDRALIIEPRNSQARAQRALWRVFRSAMPIEDAVAEGRRAVQDDPLNAWVGGMNAQILGIAGRHDESFAEAERSHALDADSFYAHWNLIRGHAWSGRYDRAIEEAPALFGASGRHIWALGLLGWTYAKAGRADRARAVYDELEGRSRHEFVSPAWLAIAAGSAGLPDESILFMERAVAERDPIVLWSRHVQFFDFVRAHPRFTEVMRGVWE
jgi:tetratricopeptide (TPR) repeat protein